MFEILRNRTSLPAGGRAAEALATTMREDSCTWRSAPWPYRSELSLRKQLGDQAGNEVGRPAMALFGEQRAGDARLEVQLERMGAA